MLAGSMKLGSGTVRGLGHIHGVGWDSHGISSERNWKPHCSLNTQQRHKWGICRFQSHWVPQNFCICRSLCLKHPLLQSAWRTPIHTSKHHLAKPLLQEAVNTYFFSLLCLAQKVSTVLILPAHTHILSPWPPRFLGTSSATALTSFGEAMPGRL